MKKKVRKIIVFIIITACLMLFCFSVTAQNKKIKTNSSDIIKGVAKVMPSLYGVGSGTFWPSNCFAPYVDITDWITDKDYSVNGVLSLGKISEESGAKYFNIGFVNYTEGTNETIVKNGIEMLDWSFGGYPGLSEHNNDGWQYEGIKKVIKSVREKGGDVALSFGGGYEMNFFQKTQDVYIIKNTYLDVINGFGLTRIDLDIEGGALKASINKANAKALAQVQKLTGVTITLTLPVVPTGLTASARSVLNTYLENGIDIKVVNIMTMCYGEDFLFSGESYGESTVRAAVNTQKQIKNCYQSVLGVTLTDAQAYEKTATTLSIGKESSKYPIFTSEWAQIMFDYAVEKEFGMISYWSMNRDSTAQYNSGINKPYSFAEIYSDYTSKINSKYITDPVESGKEIISPDKNEQNNDGKITDAISDEKSLIISFETNGGSKFDNLKITDANNISSQLEIPSKDNYKFDGWYLDKNFTVAFDEKTLLESDTILYAKWSELTDLNESPVQTKGLLMTITTVMILIITTAIIIIIVKKRNNF